MGLGRRLDKKNNFQDQNWRGPALGKHPKKIGPLLIAAAVEASNFKFGAQLGFGEYVIITTLVPNLAEAG